MTPPRDLARRQCPASGCVLLIPPSKLLCKQHWFMVPPALRDAVESAYGYGTGVGSVALLKAQAAALDALEARLARVPR